MRKDASPPVSKLPALKMVIAVNIQTSIGIELSAMDLLARATCPRNSTVIVSGSLLEGLGNTHSDVDIYVFSSELPKVSEIGKRNYFKAEGDCVRQVFDALDNEGLCFDVEYYLESELNTIIKKLEDLYDKARHSTKILRQQLTYHEDDLIHKCLIGVEIAGRELSELIDVASVKSKFSFVKYRGLAGGYPEFKDIRGMFYAGDMDSCYGVMRRYVEEHAMALTYVAGDTNTKDKWLIRKLRRLPANNNDLAEKVIEWLYSDVSTEARRREAILRGCDIIDLIFEAMRHHLNSNSSFFSISEALDLTEREYQREQIKDHQTFEEYEFRRRQFSGKAPTVRSFLENAA
jgi:hypothetical protein